MTGDQVKQIVTDALNMPAAQRGPFVQRQCGGDAQALADVQSLLEAALSAERQGFFNETSEVAPEPADEPHAASPGGGALAGLPEKVGRYRILELIGEGGMGIVYRAEQRSPIRREAVVKVIKLGMDTKLVIARFEAERQALAMMDHPHIAKVYEAGADALGRPYFAMEYVKGTVITDYADRNHLSIQQRLELFLQVCQAIQHAHHKGIIHRDIKPGNVLVSTQDGKPFAKVIDFGIAKATTQRLTDRTLFTEHVNMIGTPAYMSPEQADGNIDIDTRTDVYALGVLLYELLTGNTPFDARRLRSAALNEMARIIREEDPPRPSTRVSTLKSAAAAPGAAGGSTQSTLAQLAKGRGLSADAYVKTLRGEIDWIVMKAVEKDRVRRYETPNSLAEDIQRHLDGVPVEAAPPGFTYRAGKFIRRYRVPVTAAVVLAGTLIAATAVISVMAFQLSSRVRETREALAQAQASEAKEVLQRQEADRQREIAANSARRANYESARNQAQYLIEQNQLDQALAAAKEAYRLGGGWEDGLLINRIVNTCRANWQLEHRLRPPSPPLAVAVVDPDMPRLLVVSTGPEIIAYDLQDGHVAARAAWSRAASRLVPFKGRSTCLVCVRDSSISVVAVKDFSVVAEKDVSVVAEKDFSPRRVIGVETARADVLVTLSDDTIHVLPWNLSADDEISWPAEARRKNSQPLTKLAFSPDGKMVIAGGVTWTNECVVWDRQRKATWLTPFTANLLRFTGDAVLRGVVLKVGSAGYAVREFSLARNIPRLPFVAEPAPVVSEMMIGEVPWDDLSFTKAMVADDTSVTIAGELGIGRLNYRRDAAAGMRAAGRAERYSSIVGLPDAAPRFVGLSDDGRRLILSSGPDLLVFESGILSSGSSYTKGFNSALGENAMYEVAQMPDSLACRVTPTDPRSPARVFSFPVFSPSEKGWNVIVSGAAVSADQTTLSIRCSESRGFMSSGESVRNHAILIHSGLEPATGRPGNKPPVVIRLALQDEVAAQAARMSGSRIHALSPDGRYVLVGTRLESGSVGELYRTSDGKLVHVWTSAEPLGSAVAPLPRGRCFADISPGGRAIRLISWETGAVDRQIACSGLITWLCASSDGRELVAHVESSRIERYDAATGQKLASLDSELMPIAWPSHGDVFLAQQRDPGASLGGTIVVADCATAKSRAVLQRRADKGTPAAFSGDGQAFMYENPSSRVSLIRWLSPEMADRSLSMARSDATNLAGPVSAIPTIELPRRQVLPAGCLDATDAKLLRSKLGSEARIAGTIISVRPSRANDRWNLVMAPEDSGLLIYLPPNALTVFNEKFGGDIPGALLGRDVIVSGTVELYGGRTAALAGRLQITVEDAAQLSLAGPATLPTSRP